MKVRKRSDRLVRTIVVGVACALTTLLYQPASAVGEPAEAGEYVRLDDPAIPTTEPGDFQCGLNTVITYDPVQSLTTYYRNCASYGRRLHIWLYPNEMPFDEYEPWCVAPNSTRMLVGPRYPSQGPFDGMFNGVFIGGACTDFDPPFPRDSLAATVQAPRRPASDAVNPLAGARWELWYEGRCNGLEADPIEWCPVLTQVDSENRPTGPAAAGYLDGQGQLPDADIVYPQSYLTADGTTWHGCVEAVPAVPHLLGNACADDKLVLRVFPVNADGSIKVRERDNDYPDDVKPMATIPMGLHFQRTEPGQQVHLAESPGAHLYSAAINGRRNYTMSVVFEVNDVAFDHYNPETNVIHIDSNAAAYTTPERLMGFRFMDVAYPTGFTYSAECARLSFLDLALDDCQFIAGLAVFYGVMAENDPGSTASFSEYNNGFVNDLESCVQRSYGGSELHCWRDEYDFRVGGVAAGLYDLVDDTPNEWNNGKRDGSRGSADMVFTTILTHYPDRVHTFLKAWEATNAVDEDRETLWGNRLAYLDDYDAGMEMIGGGLWSGVECAAPGRCEGSDFLASKPGGAEAPELRWNAVSAVRPGLYLGYTKWDIWVRVPHLTPHVSADVTTAAVYEVETRNGHEYWTIDQKAAAGSWVKLRPDTGFVLDHEDENVGITLRLAPGHEGEQLLADGLLVTPRA